ncbi:MAG: hypothetical protein SGJ24_09075 [Chloroflexota bacterium]|nr:hypothetical protein [Chloroflexota bacterium]
MTHPILKPGFVRRDDRGTLTEILNADSWASILHGEMVAGAVIGNHYHKETVVFLYLLSGGADITTVHVHTGMRDHFVLQAGEGVMLVTDESHAVRFTVRSQFLLLKSHPYDRDNPDTYPLLV